MISFFSVSDSNNVAKYNFAKTKRHRLPKSSNNFVTRESAAVHKMLSPNAGSRRGSLASFLANSSSNSFGDDERKSLLGSDPHKLQGYVDRLLDVRVQKRVMFGAA